jgi:photosystem II stability/assembly factor-like uncharacterized protein
MKQSIFLGIVVTLTIISCRSTTGPKMELIIEPLETGSNVSIRALHVVSERVIWAAGSEGSYLLSTDGGNSWKTGQVEMADSDDFRSLHAWDSQHALIFGVSNPGRGYYTSTAGEDWEIVYENSEDGIFFNTLKFANKNMGVALSDAIDSIPFIIRTADGGRLWERILDIPPLNLNEFHFAASNSCIEYLPSGGIWIVTGGGDARVFHSPDHGETWSVSETEISHRGQSSGIFSISFVDNSRGVIVGGTYDNPGLNDSIAAYTDNGGATWQLSETMPSAYRSSVTWLNSDRDIALAVGKTGWDYSVDYGKSWIAVSDSGYYTARAINGTLKGFAAGSGGRVAKFELK